MGLTREQEHAREVRILGDWKMGASICLEPADDNLVINGRGHTLDCDSEARFMTHAIQLGGERPSAETLLHITLRNATLRFLWQIPSRDWSILYLECASLVLENVIFQIPGPLQWSNWVSGQDLQLQMKDVMVVATNLPSREPHTSWMWRFVGVMRLHPSLVRGVPARAVPWTMARFPSVSHSSLRFVQSPFRTSVWNPNSQHMQSFFFF